VTFEKLAAEDVIQPDMFDEDVESTDNDNDPEVQQAKKEHWKKWLAALGILGGVGAAGYYGWKHWRPAMEATGIVPKTTPPPAPGTPEANLEAARNGPVNLAGLGGFSAGTAAPFLSKLPLVRNFFDSARKMTGNMQGMNDVALQAATATAPASGESPAVAPARQLNTALGGKENLSRLIMDHLNAPGSTPENPMTGNARLDPLTAIYRMYTQAKNLAYKNPNTNQMLKALDWANKNPGAKQRIGGWDYTVPAVQAELQKRTGSDVTLPRLQKGFSDIRAARDPIASKGRVGLSLGLGSALGYTANKFFPPEQLARP
jgi:hypothetical protein